MILSSSRERTKMNAYNCTLKSKKKWHFILNIKIFIKTLKMIILKNWCCFMKIWIENIKTDYKKISLMILIKKSMNFMRKRNNNINKNQKRLKINRLNNKFHLFITRLKVFKKNPNILILKKKNNNLKLI